MPPPAPPTTNPQSRGSRLGPWALLALSALLALCSTPNPIQAQDVLEKWNQRYDGTTDGVHEGRAVAVDAAGNVVVTGPSVSSNGFDFYTVKYRAADGFELWSDRYDGPGDADDVPVAVTLDAAGNVIVTGGSTSSSSGLDVYTRKYNGTTGADLWNQRDDGPARGDDAATAIALDAEGNVVVTGGSAGDGTGQDFYTAKYAAGTGSRLWSRRYNGPGNRDDSAVAIVVDAAGDVLVTGLSRGGNDSIDWYTAKYDGGTDAVIWDERRNGTGNGEDRAMAVAVDAAGDVVITGSSDNGRNLDLMVTKYSGADGSEVWSQRYNGPGDGDDAGTAIAVDPQGNVIVTGTSAGSNDTQDFYTACYHGRTGQRIWFERFDGPRGRDEVAFPFGLALGPLNSVAITGATQMTAPPAAEFDFITILYTADSTDADADGLPDAWEITHWGTTTDHGPSDDDDLDGVVELLEYAFGGDPTFPDPSRLPEAAIENGFLTLTLNKRAGVTFVVESTGSLAQGDWSVATTTVITDSAGILKVRDNEPTSDGQARFLRVRVTAP